MAESSPLQLAYLIEISVVLNLAFREIAYDCVDNHIKKARDEKLERLRSLTKNEHQNVTKFDSYDEFMGLFTGDTGWGGENTSLHQFYTDRLLNWKAYWFSGAAVVYTVIILVICTVGAALGVNPPLIWWMFFSLLIVFLIAPVYFYVRTNRCMTMLLGYSDWRPITLAYRPAGQSTGLIEEFCKKVEEDIRNAGDRTISDEHLENLNIPD